MESPSICRSNKVSGFTLIETLISIGILALLGGLGLVIGIDSYKSSSFRSEKIIIVSTLQKARSRAMNNIDEQKHGVHFQTTPSVKYIIFEGPDYATRVVSKDQIIDASFGVEISGSTEVVFEQLSGSCLTCAPANEITVSHDGKSNTITINNEGRIHSQ